MGERVRACRLLILSLLLVGLVSPLRAETAYPALDPRRGVMTMAPLLDRTTPAVVNVSVVSRVPAAENPLFADPFFRRFFDLPELPREREAISAGSGVIVDGRRGYVLTNHHVVSGAGDDATITVTLSDGKTYRASIAGEDASTDLAVLTLEDGLAERGIGAALALRLGRRSTPARPGPVVHCLGVDLEFLAHGKRDAILADQGLDAPGIAESLAALL